MKIGTKLLRNLLIGVLVAGIVIATFSATTKTVQAETITTTTYYYYTTTPGAQPMVINGITFYPTSTVPPQAQYYPYTPASTYQVQQPVYQPPVYQQPQQISCQPAVYQQNYVNGAIIPQINGGNCSTTVSNGNGINNEAENRMNDLRWYASERGWNTNWNRAQDTDCVVKLNIEFSNRNGKFTVQQTTSIVSAGKYNTTWTYNGQASSADAIKQALSAYCAK